MNGARGGDSWCHTFARHTLLGSPFPSFFSFHFFFYSLTVPAKPTKDKVPLSRATRAQSEKAAQRAKTAKTRDSSARSNKDANLKMAHPCAWRDLNRITGCFSEISFLFVVRFLIIKKLFQWSIGSAARRCGAKIKPTLPLTLPRCQGPRGVARHVTAASFALSFTLKQKVRHRRALRNHLQFPPPFFFFFPNLPFPSTRYTIKRIQSVAARQRAWACCRGSGKAS